MAIKYVFVTGGVVSSLGKGITTASLGRLLKARGYTISMQKMDPYYNVDPGLLSPLQHGEAFITEDGVAADLDLGHYERYADIQVKGEASVTTGKIHKRVMERELNGEYKGGTVQVVPHVTNEIKLAIRTAAENSGADIALVEIGGTVGDMESAPFLEAIRQMRWDLPDHGCCFIHVTLLPYISVAGELKTKPTQHSVKNLRSIGIQPDVIVCRTEQAISREGKEKIALFCNVKATHVVQNMDVPFLYEVPLRMEEEGLADIVCQELGLPKTPADLRDWQEMLNTRKNPEHAIKVALVGKYVALRDAYLSVSEALTHAGLANRASVEIRWISAEDITDDNAKQVLSGCQAVIIPGGYGDRGAEGIVSAARYARENNVPFLGIGFGMQLAVVEAARNLLGLKDAHSTEVDPETPHPVVRIPEDRICQNGSRSPSRMGGYDVELTESHLRDIYGRSCIHERHGNRFEVNEDYAAQLSQKGFECVGVSPQGGYLEAFEMKDHPFYAAVAYHPEFLSRPNRAHPLFTAFVKAALKAQEEA